ncbi:MAG TPA: ribose-phosphate pyrophosphokinase [Burkholderiales bacterium]|nr:ribose-phosphate pyrophosphokinase [Burkholderiales bacterium]
MPQRDELFILAGDANPDLAREIARLCDLDLIACTIAAFADGETRLRIEGDVTNRSVCIVQSTSGPTNERLMTLALLADAARGAGANRILAVIPYFGYARQDVRKSYGEPRSARLAARLLGVAGVERVIVLELHSPALESAFDPAVVQVQADEAMLPVLRDWRDEDLVIVAPDAGGLKRAQRYAMALATPLVVVAKTRTSPDVAIALQVLGDVKNKRCLIVDDMASTGGTIASAAQALLQQGAREVDALFIHAVMAPGALERICAASVQRMITTDSIAMPPDPRVQVVSIAPLLARVLTEQMRTGDRKNVGSGSPAQ